MISFARTPGAKDKQKRKRRLRWLAGGAMIAGSAGLGIGMVKRIGRIRQVARDLDYAERVRNQAEVYRTGFTMVNDSVNIPRATWAVETLDNAVNTNKKVLNRLIDRQGASFISSGLLLSGGLRTLPPLEKRQSINMNKNNYFLEFARTKGSKDKQKRKRRLPLNAVTGTGLTALGSTALAGSLGVKALKEGEYLSNRDFFPEEAIKARKKLNKPLLLTSLAGAGALGLGIGHLKRAIKNKRNKDNFNQYISLVEFARPKGAKDKQKRKRKTLPLNVATGTSLIGAGYGSHVAGRKAGNLIDKMANEVLKPNLEDLDMAKRGLRRIGTATGLGLGILGSLHLRRAFVNRKNKKG